MKTLGRSELQQSLFMCSYMYPPAYLPPAFFSNQRYRKNRQELRFQDYSLIIFLRLRCLMIWSLPPACAICQIQRTDGALEANFSFFCLFFFKCFLHMEVRTSEVQRGIKIKISCEGFCCQQPGERRCSNSVERCLVWWNQSWRAERINAENGSETYPSVASTSPFSSSGDSDRSGCVLLKSGRCGLTSALV